MTEHKQTLRAVTGLLVGLMLIGCGGGDSGDADSTSTRPTIGAAPPSTSAATDAQPLNAELVAQGEELFQTKICNTCHTIGGGRLVGPDLEGVVDRRSEDWILAMIMNPDSMIRSDSIARRLLGEYMTPMVNQGVTREEAEALHEFLRSGGSG